MVWGKKTGRLKPCKWCQKGFYVSPCEDDGAKKVKLFCDAKCFRTWESSPEQVSMRLWSHVDKGPHPKGCWQWTGGVYKATKKRLPYGHFQASGPLSYSHRAVWIFTHGPIPEGMNVLHSCDNPLCCNPSHLRLGTHEDNMRDMDLRGRRRNQYGAPRQTAST